MRRQVGPAPSRLADEVTVDWSISAPVEISDKRFIPRVTTIVSAATPVFNTDEIDCLDITNLGEDITSMTKGMTGNPYNFQHLMVRIYTDATRRITWGDAYVSSGVANLLTLTQANRTHQIGLEYNLSRRVWVCLAVDPLGT